ncbi:MAG: chorismate lyase [Spongiibacteraceae bacterium]|nr:chorismate lyase [Spongiibacteraceae bacterium]
MPATTARWLLDRGSLTRHLQRASDGDFRVEVVHQGWARPRRSEQQLLAIPQGQRALIREVLLRCHDQPWVFARSVLPRTTLVGRLRRLRRFGSDSLGQMLFNDASMRRADFEVALLPGQDPGLPETVRCNQVLWARRSRFSLDDRPLMVSEIFLPAFHPW